ncbi:MAG: carboxypeptidase M32 [Alphaproteobacteria bacterium]|nr:carboxypeptidase M32 [Alphaproteobacteria bacterium]MDE1969875.1 carboxypeptidase M32 [Alphaproteobacteria bacterium]
MTAAYATLETRFKRLGLVNEAVAMLNWDTAAMMPDGAAAARAEQLAELKVIAHEILADPRLADLMDDAGRDGLDDWQRANLAEMRRLWLHATAVPADLVAAYSRACSECEMAWRKARPANDFAAILPRLQRVLDLTREVAAAKAVKLGVSPYEALLDQFEPGGRIAEIDRLFDHLAERLPALIEGALAAQAARTPSLRPAGPFPVEAQRQAAQQLMARLGFEFDHGRLDQSLHPFCGGTPDDVRITTRYDEADFARALMGVLHETGHALYERGLPAVWRRQPVGEARGMSIHESQSLLIEMQVCRSREFLEFAAPILRECFGGAGPEWEAANLYRLGTRVVRSLIRVDADEVTYPAHVILRYRLERALIAAELELADLPDAWSEGMERLLAVTPPDDRDGCLQDIHWYDGAWGYFPTYTLGAMTAAQLFDAAKRAVPAIPGAIAHGDFAPLLAWLRANVHNLGSRYSARDILVRATGKPLDAAIFEGHLRARYLAA